MKSPQICQEAFKEWAKKKGMDVRRGEHALWENAETAKSYVVWCAAWKARGKRFLVAFEKVEKFAEEVLG